MAETDHPTSAEDTLVPPTIPLRSMEPIVPEAEVPNPSHSRAITPGSRSRPGSRPDSRSRPESRSKYSQDSLTSFGSSRATTPSQIFGRRPRRTKVSASRNVRASVLRTSGLLEGGMEEKDVSTWAIVSEMAKSPGRFTDRVVRAWWEAKRRNMKGEEEASHLVNILLNSEPGTKQAVGHEYCIAELRREQLRNNLMLGIISENKHRGVFARTGWAELIGWSQFVQIQKREVAQLTTKVANWRFCRKLLEKTVANAPEDLWFRKERMDNFWSSFHDRSRLVENPPSCLENDFVPHSGGKSRPETSSGYTHRLPALGMRWEFEYSAPWRTLDCASGTNHQRLTRAPARPRQQDVSTSARHSGMQKSASAPNLKKASDKSGKSHKRLLPPIKTDKTRYLQECDFRRVSPMPLTFITGHSRKLTAQGKDLVDGELTAMAATLGPDLEAVNLFGNALITDLGMVPILNRLYEEDVRPTLSTLILGGCCKLGCYSVNSIVKLAGVSQKLRILDLSKIHLATNFQFPLCKAIGKNKAIQTVNLSETGLQPHPLIFSCLQELLGGESITDLDVSWNNFDGDVFQELGKAVISSGSLCKLSVANCASLTDVAAAHDKVPPLSRFLEMLSRDGSLTNLNISMNRCNYMSALILEDSLDKHQHLKELTLTDNPLGVLGLRSILRLLCRDHTALLHVDTDGSYTGERPESDLNATIFSYSNPGGKYDLNLWRPYHRALLRMLYKTTDVIGILPEEAFTKLTYFPKPGATAPWIHCTPGPNGNRQVPDTGNLTLVFTVEPAIFKRFMQGPTAIKDSNHIGFLTSYYKLMRFQPGKKKVVPLCSWWADLENNSTAQEVMLSALSRDFNFTVPILETMCRLSRGAHQELVSNLISSLPGTEDSIFLTGLVVKSLRDYMGCLEYTQNVMALNIENPTGSYSLDLANSADRAVGERLLLLDRWEAALDRKHGRRDISRHGNASHIRNEMFNGRSLHLTFHSVAEWKMSEAGQFEFDYVSNQRPKRNMPALSSSLWESILIETYEAPSTPEDKIAALRAISANFYLAASHVRALIGYFKTAIQRSNVFIIFCMRIVDMHNEKMYSCRFESKEEIAALQCRLGYAFFFPFFQPENANIDFDFSVYDQRLAASIWVSLACKEKITHNFHDYAYTKNDGTEVPLPLGVPRSWADINSCPKEGKFSAQYRCAPEDRNFNFRKELASTFGFFDVQGLCEDDVNWWTGLTEPPEDVLELLEFFISRYDNIETPFLEIDGVDGNGVITIREFTEGIDQMGCKKFDVKKGQKGGPTKDQRIDKVFRYLDPGGEGSVSKGEWQILGQLWKEFAQSIREFVHFLILSFGEDLLAAWEALDDDASGELTEEEWKDAIDRIGYFGPQRVVFALLDMSDDGNISFDEFEVLNRYKPAKDDDQSSSQ